jgi:hypothetical protein
LDRALGFTVYPGEAELDIKEVTNPQGDPQLEKALSELLDFRKLMLVYRLIHFEDPVIDYHSKKKSVPYLQEPRLLLSSNRTCPQPYRPPC